MAVKILWTKRAQHSFERIVDYLLTEWSLAVAAKFVNKSNAFIEILKDHPRIGKQEMAQKGLRSFVLSRQTTVFYRIKNKDTIILLNFFDTRQEPKKEAKSFTL